MIAENINKTKLHPNVLVAPLDWGLGHYTRCIPIIKALQQAGFNVLVAAEKKGEALYKKEFPGITILPLQGYRIRYSHQKILFWPAMLFQSFKIGRMIRREHAWLEIAAIKFKIDLIISDNRFGFYHRSIPSIYMTHQLHIETGNRIINKVAQKINYNYINKFKACWVPDVKGSLSLAGILSHPKVLPAVPVSYIGIQSRFVPLKNEKKYDVLFLLSGPEPSRTSFENLCLKQAALSKRKICLCRGLPAEAGIDITTSGNVHVVNHLPAKKLNEVISESELIVCRSGYSTIMDLVAMNRNAFLIPTPGQKEQEYLAAYLTEKKWFNGATQDKFELERILNLPGNFTPPGNFRSSELKDEIEKIFNSFSLPV